MAAPQAPRRKLRLGVNIDHVATIRNARGGKHPDPIRAARVAERAGADGITAHLREDRRHIRDDDMARLKAEIDKPLNFEMAATNEMVAAAARVTYGGDVIDVDAEAEFLSHSPAPPSPPSASP